MKSKPMCKKIEEDYTLHGAYLSGRKGVGLDRIVLRRLAWLTTDLTFTGPA